VIGLRWDTACRLVLAVTSLWRSHSSPVWLLQRHAVHCNC